MSDALVHVKKLNNEAIMLPGTGQRAELVLKEIQVSEEMVYRLPGGQVGLLSSVWDFVGQERGIKFSAPRVLENTEDRVMVEVRATYFNRMGVEVSDVETYEIDCRRLMELSRQNWAPSPWEDELDSNGNRIWDRQAKRYKSRKLSDKELAQKVQAWQAQGYLLDEPVYDENDIPVAFKRKLPREAEKQLWDNFLTLKRHKLSKAITCAHRRLIQRAIGTKTLTPDNLCLQFPSVAAVFSQAEIRQAVSNVYGEEDEMVAEMVRPPVTLDQEPEEAAWEPTPTPEPEPRPEPERVTPRSEGGAGADWRQVVAAAKTFHGKAYSTKQLMNDLVALTGEALRQNAPAPCGYEHGEPSLMNSSPKQLAGLVAYYEQRLQQRLQTEAAV